jgi:hypothetical protein
MRGKERFSAPEKGLTLIMRFSAGNPSALQVAENSLDEGEGLHRLRKNSGFVSGHDFSRAVNG